MIPEWNKIENTYRNRVIEIESVYKILQFEIKNLEFGIQTNLKYRCLKHDIVVGSKKH